MKEKISHKLGLNKSPALRKAYDAWKGFLRGTQMPFPLRVQGFWMKGLSLADFFAGAYEPGTTGLFKRIALPGSVCIDVGADYGYFTLLLSDLVGDSGRIYAFEPSVSRYAEYLVPNVARNRCQNVTLFDHALSDARGRASYYPESHSLYRIADADDPLAEKVDCKLLDDCIPADGKVDIIKIDVEGNELKVLKGMPRILSGNRGIKIVIEINPNVLKKAGTSADELLRFLEAAGFSFYGIGDDASLRAFAGIRDLIATAAAAKYINIVCQRNP